MQASTAIIIGAAFIAGAILFLFRMDISAGGNGVYRLDRWTGVVTRCGAGLVDIDRQARQESFQVYCEPK